MESRKTSAGVHFQAQRTAEDKFPHSAPRDSDAPQPGRSRNDPGKVTWEGTEAARGTGTVLVLCRILRFLICSFSLPFVVLNPKVNRNFGA